MMLKTHFHSYRKNSGFFLFRSDETTACDELYSLLLVLLLFLLVLFFFFFLAFSFCVRFVVHKFARNCADSHN